MMATVMKVIGGQKGRMAYWHSTEHIVRSE